MNHMHGKDEFDPELGLKITRKKTLKLLIFCLIVGFIGVFGFLIYKEYRKAGITGYIFAGATFPDHNHYTNNYWGFSLDYPGKWYAVNGSIHDGEYYFASEPINFIDQLDSGQAIIAVKTYNNWKKLSFEDWLLDQEQNYFPLGTVEKSASSFQDYQAKNYKIALQREINNVKYWEMTVISRDEASKYELILMTKDQDDAARYQQIFDFVKNSFQFYKGYGI